MFGYGKCNIELPLVFFWTVLVYQHLQILERQEKAWHIYFCDTETVE